MQERLEREHNLSLIMSAPTVFYRCMKTDGTELEVSNPAALPDASKRQSISEPIVKMEIITPSEYNGALMELCQQRRGARCATMIIAPCQHARGPVHCRAEVAGCMAAEPPLCFSTCGRVAGLHCTRRAPLLATLSCSRTTPSAPQPRRTRLCCTLLASAAHALLAHAPHAFPVLRKAQMPLKH